MTTIQHHSTPFNTLLHRKLTTSQSLRQRVRYKYAPKPFKHSATYYLVAIPCSKDVTTSSTLPYYVMRSPKTAGENLPANSKARRSYRRRYRCPWM